MKVPAKTKIELMKEINELRAQFKGTKKKFSTSAEAQAQSSETTARSILDQATDMIIVCDENGKITRTSEVTHRYISGKFLLNKPFDAVLKLRFSSLHPLRQGNFSVSGILAGKILKKEEVTLQTEGQSFYFLLSARPLKDRRGRIGGCVVTLTEIGERKQMEAEFARLASFPQLNPNPIVEVDLAQYVVGLQNASYAVLNPSNGAVTLLGDGHTAQFIPAPGYAGLGSFRFTATDGSLIITNDVGVLVSPLLESALTPFARWQVHYFSSTNSPAALPGADPDGDGQNNLAEFSAGTNPKNSSSAFRIVSAVRQSTDVVIAWETVGGLTNAVQAASGNGNNGYATNYIDIGGPLVISGSGEVSTNYTDVGGATNRPARFYRIRLVP